MRTRALALTALLVTGGLGAAACSSTSSSATTTTTAAASTSKDIVQLAASDPNLSTLVTAVKAAGLVSTLEGKGPYTVFAPTNAAFAALPAGTLQALLQPADKAKLTSILTYHVVPGAYTSSNLPTGSVMTVNGATVTVAESGGKVTITDGTGKTVQVTEADLHASNGVVHVINGVLLPPGS